MLMETRRSVGPVGICALTPSCDCFASATLKSVPDGNPCEPTWWEARGIKKHPKKGTTALIAESLAISPETLDLDPMPRVAHSSLLLA